MLDDLVLKLVLTPTLIGAASLAGRRWGPGVSGWLVGLPLTSGPVALFLALAHGEAFAAAAAIGILAGTVSQTAFALVYAWLAFRCRWPLTVLAGSVVFVASTAALQRLPLPLGPVSLLVVVALATALRLMPGDSGAAVAVADPPPRWDVPARMLVATAFVLLLTGLAPALGPRLTGLLSPFPLYGAVLAGFAHHLQGPVAAGRVFRGMLLGLFAFAGFFFVLAALLERAGMALAFTAAIAVTLAIQAGSLGAVRPAVR